MKHKLFKKKNAVNNFIDIAEIETDESITDFTMIDDKTFFFTHGKSIGLIKDGEITPYWSGQKELGEEVRFGSVEGSVYFNPSSIYYNKYDKSLYVVENCGRFIRRIELDTLYTYSIISGHEEYKLNYIFSKSPKFCKTSIDINGKNEIYWTSEIVHRCFKFYNGDFSVVAGNGRAGYSVYNDPANSNLSFPCGVYDMNNNIYIVDSYNGKIRSVNNGIHIIVSDLQRPQYLKRIDNRLLFVEQNNIRSMSLEGKLHPFAVYKGNRVINICCYNSDIYILEGL